MGKSKRSKGPKRQAKRRGGVVGEVLGALSFDVELRTDKLRVWLERHPGELPAGLTHERIAELLGS